MHIEDKEYQKRASGRIREEIERKVGEVEVEK